MDSPIVSLKGVEGGFEAEGGCGFLRDIIMRPLYFSAFYEATLFFGLLARIKLLSTLTLSVIHTLA